MEVKQHAPGSFSWFELHTSDAAAAKRFYTTMFGWTTVDHDMGENGVYTILQKGDKPLAGLYQDNSSGAPPHWNTYVTVTDADAATAKAESLGAKVLMPPMDVPGVGRMSAIQDPTGAAVSLWTPKEHHGMGAVDEVNAFCWNELMTKDVAGAARFYTSLLGWEAKGEPGVAQYIEWINGGRSIGGLMKLPAEAESMGVPPNWLPYIQVADCDGAAQKAKGLGAVIHVQPTDIADVGRFSVFGDPQGAGIAVVQLRS